MQQVRFENAIDCALRPSDLRAVDLLRKHGHAIVLDFVGGLTHDDHVITLAGILAAIPTASFPPMPVVRVGWVHGDLRDVVDADLRSQPEWLKLFDCLGRRGDR